ncbi:dynein axonemal assembly factor 3-like [Haliotis rufescens]|uniref:dynein axonemal assembly factor 3-like n=1 Tax=Haliotis rufescens TaxID=6454 RepID=UPI00201F35A8|nr:dynein axonemal assembly factor 3-like [Haliotis rufescens]
MDGLGTITWWGFSPAIDFQDADVGALMEKTSLQDTNDVVNILLVGAGDIRHILKTIANRKRHKHKKINMFVCEAALELYARDILLMTVALEMQDRMGLQEKSELFLELYGNILIREQTMQYVQKKATEFIKMVTDVDYLEEKLPVFDLSQLKFKERDFLEGIFKLWQNTKFTFDVSKCWDLRMRQNLKTRYDTRMNVFDWDYHMGLAERDADVVNKSEYQTWRNTGVAFEFREGTYDTPNKTMASARVFDHQGEKHGRMGYWGDIIVSPYISLGIESEEQSFFKKCNNLYTKTAEDVSQFNMQAMLHELATGERYKQPVKEEPKQSSSVKLTEITEEEEEEENNEKEKMASSSQHELPYQAIPVDDVKVTFLPIGPVKDHVAAKSKYQKFFDVVYFSNSMVHQLTPDVSKIFAKQCTVILETAQFMLEIKKEQTEEFLKKTASMAKTAGCEQVETVGCKSKSFTRHLYKGDE